MILENMQDLYKKMILIRAAQERISLIYPEGKIRCPVHLCTGQEAACVGVCSALSIEDWVFSSHRNHGWYIAKGGNINNLFAELYGKKDGCCHGKGGSMHLAAPEAGFSITSSIVAGTLSHAVGAAQSFKIRNEDKIAVANCGDAAAEEGVFFECLNFAKLFSLPVLFCVENNGLSVDSPIEKRRAFDLSKVCDGFGINYSYVIAENVEYVAEKASATCLNVRNGHPAVIELRVNRFRAHVHPPSWSAHLTAMDRDALDPINKYVNCDWITREFKKANKIVDEAVEFAERSSFPAGDDLLEDVYEKKFLS